MLANAKWHNVSWRNGTKGRLEARFAAVRVRIADGPPQRIKDMGQQLGPVAAKLRLGYGVVEVDAVAASIITVRVLWWRYCPR